MKEQIVDLISNPGVLMYFDMESGDMICAESSTVWKGVFWKDVYTVNDLYEILWQAVIHDIYIGVCYHDGRFSIYTPNDVVYALYLGHVELVKPASKNRLPQVKLGDRVCTTISSYMEEYNSPDDFFHRGQMYSRIGQWAQGEVSTLKGLNLDFEPHKVINLKTWTNRFHKPSVILEYQGIPPVFGLTGIEKVFPRITNRDLRRLYNQFGAPLPRKLK